MPKRQKGAFKIVLSESGDPDEFNIKPLENFPPPIPEDQRKISILAYGTWGTLKHLKEQGVFDQRVDKAIIKNRIQTEIDQQKYKLFNEFRTRLLEATSTGVEGDCVHPRLSLEALQQIKDEVASRKGMKIKILYLLRLAGIALLIVALAVLFLVSQHYNLPVWSKFQDWFNFEPSFEFFKIPRAEPYAWVIIGSMAGAWLSVASTRRTVSFEEIPSFLSSVSEPLLRLVFVALLASALALFIELKVLVIVLGQADLVHFSGIPPDTGSSDTTEVAPKPGEPERIFDPGVAVLLGLIAGIGEKAVSRKVFERTRGAFADEQ